MAYDREDLMRRLAAGEWLKTGAVAMLTGKARKTIYNMIQDGRIRAHMSGGTQRLCHPDDVRALLPPDPVPDPVPDPDHDQR